MAFALGYISSRSSTSMQLGASTPAREGLRASDKRFYLEDEGPGIAEAVGVVIYGSHVVAWGVAELLESGFHKLCLFVDDRPMTCVSTH